LPKGAADDRVRDPDSTAWLADLRGKGQRHDEAVNRLYELLLRVAWGEIRRRRGRLSVGGAELDDLAHQAAADAVVGVLSRLAQFRGESRFTTWACKFAIFEASTKLNRHFWQRPAVAMDVEDWDRLPDRFGLGPARASEWRAVLGALHGTVDDLSERQRRVFVAIVVNGVPLDAVVAELGSNRNAIYKTLFDARRKLRASLVTHGYLEADDSRRT
jgi:RNA polymerase sigma-70 factor, ECF subfamily